MNQSTENWTNSVPATALAARLSGPRSPSGRSALHGLDGPGGLPAARALADALGRLIAAGELVAGARLPTERALAVELGLARGTVSAAYRLAKRRGLIVARQ